MAKKAYIGVNGAARKIKNGYIGVNGVARKIKKAYVGIGGVARPCWNTIDFYYGDVTPLSVARTFPAAVSLDSYAVFAGGGNGPTDSNGLYGTITDAYNAGLTRLVPTKLDYETWTPAGARIGKYALIAGGLYRGYYAGGISLNVRHVTEDTTAYDNNLTMTRPDDLVCPRDMYLHSATVGNYAVFTGISYDDNSNDDLLVEEFMDAYNTSLVHTVHPGLYNSRKELATASTNDYCIFAGGEDIGGFKCDYVEAYTASLSVLQIEGIDEACVGPSAATAGDYILVVGGRTGNFSYVDTVNVYDKYLTKRPSIKFPRDGYKLSSTSHRNYAFFAAGISDNHGGYLPYVYTIDEYLTVVEHTKLPKELYGTGAAAIGNFVLFAGGSGREYDPDTGEYLGDATYDNVVAYAIQE